MGPRCLVEIYTLRNPFNYLSYCTSKLTAKYSNGLEIVVFYPKKQCNEIGEPNIVTTLW